MKVDFYQVDVFTIALFKGNPAGVVLNADGLTEVEMQAIAREVNNSETAFVLKPANESHDFRIRYFTPNMEVPGCGHATLAASYVWAKRQGFKKREINVSLPAGVMPVELVDNGISRRIFLTQSPPKFGQTLIAKKKAQVLNALRLHANDLMKAPMQIVDTGDPKILVPLKDKNTLNNLTPDFDQLIHLSIETGCNGFHVFSLDNHNSITQAHARTFAPAVGVNEVPITGSGNGPLGAYLVRYQLAAHDNRCLQLVSKQGEDMNRSGFAYVTVKIQNGHPVSVKVGGDLRVVFNTMIEL